MLLDYKKNNDGRKMMYYLKDGVYGSLSGILNDAVEVKPYLHRVNIILLDLGRSLNMPKFAK